MAAGNQAVSRNGQRRTQRSCIMVDCEEMRRTRCIMACTTSASAWLCRGLFTRPFRGLWLRCFKPVCAYLYVWYHSCIGQHVGHVAANHVHSLVSHPAKLHSSNQTVQDASAHGSAWPVVTAGCVKEIDAEEEQRGARWNEGKCTTSV